MRVRFADHLRIVGLSVCAVFAQASGPLAHAQADLALEAQLLGKAHTLESRGRLDLASPVWQQVLLMDPRNTEALSGLARAARLGGNQSIAENYLAQLRAVAPAESRATQTSTTAAPRTPALLLGAAGNLARAGQPARAMAIYRQLYGNNPPAGTPALAYYETEAATTDGRAHSVAGLRAMVLRYPQDSRYSVALGRILAADPQTRAEARGMLEALSSDPEAKAALKQVPAAETAAAPATAYPQSSVVPRSMAHGAATFAAKDGTQHLIANVSFAAKPVVRPQAGRTAELQAAYGALNAHYLLTAEASFETVLEHNPRSWQALAGLGYVRLRQANFPGAISYLEQAMAYGGHGSAIEKALGEARFRATVQAANAALSRNDFPSAQVAFSAALEQRPGATEALRGLGGTLLQAQQGEAAIEIFRRYTLAHPADPVAWHGLLVAQSAAGRPTEALATESEIPLGTRRDLMQDPRFLLALATVDKATGNVSEAQAVLHAGLDLPFPEGGRGLTPDMQTRYAALLAAAGRSEAAVTLYQQVLAADAGNTAAWTGLITVQHATGETAAASATLHGLPPSVSIVAMRDPAFVTVVASVEVGQGHDDRACGVLEGLLAQEAGANYSLYIPAQLQLASLYVRQGNLSRALPIYHEILRKTPGRLDASRELVRVLHVTGHDTEALAQLKRLPPETRAKLETDPAYLELAGETFASAGQPQGALPYLLRAQRSLQNAGAAPSAALLLQVAALQYATHDDADLSRELAALGNRRDLTTPQREKLQAIWADWAVRRAVAKAKAGDPQGAAEVLNTALEAFASNPAVARTLADGFVAAGLAGDAEAIYRSRDMSNAPVEDFRAAITAALAAHDHKLAEIWLHEALIGYPNEPQLLLLASRYEDERGHGKRAKEYLQASVEATSAPLAGAQLARELQGAGPVSTSASQDGLEQGLAATTEAQPDLSFWPAPMEASAPFFSGNGDGQQTGLSQTLPGQATDGKAEKRLRDFSH